MEYPVRCKIVDVTGQKKLGFELKTPETSVPHIGKKGVANLLENGRVMITLDDGSIIYGDECWWSKIKE